MTLKANKVFVGSGTSGNGSLEITGSGSHLAVERRINLGRQGRGEMLVGDQATVQAGSLGIAISHRHGTATATIRGGARLDLVGDLFIAWSGAGRLSVLEGGTVHAHGVAVGAHNGDGLIHVASNGQLLLVRGLGIGLSPQATGRLRVEDGGYVQAARIAVRQSGHGILQVVDGGRLRTTGIASIGLNAGTGEATVSGTGSVWEIGQYSLNLGGLASGPSSAEGTLNLLKGGRVNVAGWTRVWDDATLHIDGGHLRTQSLHLATGASFNFLEAVS